MEVTYVFPEPGKREPNYAQPIPKDPEKGPVSLERSEDDEA